MNNYSNNMYGYNPQPMMQPTLGRIVMDESQIMPQEIAMDGQFYFFPVTDGSAITHILAKRWTPTGQIVTVRYDISTPEEAQHPQTTLNDVVAIMNERFNELGNMLRYRSKGGRTNGKQYGNASSQNGRTEPDEAGDGHCNSYGR